jgi:hypothetical protein
MKITVTSIFDLSFETTRQLIFQPATMRTVAQPVMQFKAISPAQLPKQWQANEIYRIKLYAFGFVSLGWYDIKIEIDKDEKDVCIGRDRGHGQAINVWNHAIIIERRGDKTRYSDEVDVHAGIFTPLVAGFAKLFYRHRQKRWKKIIIPNAKQTEMI